MYGHRNTASLVFSCIPFRKCDMVHSVTDEVF